MGRDRCGIQRGNRTGMAKCSGWNLERWVNHIHSHHLPTQVHLWFGSIRGLGRWRPHTHWGCDDVYRLPGPGARRKQVSLPILTQSDIWLESILIYNLQPEWSVWAYGITLLRKNFLFYEEPIKQNRNISSWADLGVILFEGKKIVPGFPLAPIFCNSMALSWEQFFPQRIFGNMWRHFDCYIFWGVGIGDTNI